MTSKKTTMQDIANSLGISKSLVSLALSDSPLVNEQRKTMIRHTAFQMNYAIKPAKIKKTSANNSIVVYVPYATLSDNEFGMKVIAGAESAINRLGMHMVLAISENGPVPSKETARGVIVCSCIDKTQLELIREAGLPVVFIDYNASEGCIDCIMADNYRGMYDATQYILDSGHRKLIFVGNNLLAHSFAMRCHGCSDCIVQNKYEMPVECRYVTDSITGKLFDEDSFCKLLESGYDATAVICVNDPTALQIYKILETRGIRIPEDMSVIGFDNIRQSSWVKPPLTTVHVHKASLGEQAVFLLMQKIEQPESYHKTVNIEVSLLERQSVRKLNQ